MTRTGPRPLQKNRVAFFSNQLFKFSVLGGEEALSWTPPNASIIKINCDGSLLIDPYRAGMGCIVRDSDGLVVCVLADCNRNMLSSVAVEGCAILLGLKWSEKELIKVCIFETDCAEVFSLIQQYDGWAPLTRGWIGECADLFASHGGWRLTRIRREANGAADWLAKKASQEEWSYLGPDAIPIWVEWL